MKKALVLLAALALSTAIYAQETPKQGAFGLTGNVGSNYYAIGAWYNMTDTIVLKPAVGIYYQSNPDQYPTYKETRFTANISLDALYELPISDSVALGLGPRISYWSGTTTDKFTAGGPDYTSKESIFDLGGVASVQYFFAKNMGVYLDVGIQASFDTTTPNVGSSYTLTSFQTMKSDLGFVLFLK
jgi:hypothetical protein